MIRMPPFLDDCKDTFPRTTHGLRACNATESVAITIYKQPLHQRFFYALLKWGWVAVPVLLAVSVLTGCDDLAAAQPASHAAQQAQAEHRRDLAASQMCKGAAFEWQGQVLTCHKER